MENVVDVLLLVEKAAVLGREAPGGTAGHPDPRTLGPVRRARPARGPVALLPIALLRRDRLRSPYSKVLFFFFSLSSSVRMITLNVKTINYNRRADYSMPRVDGKKMHYECCFGKLLVCEN